MSTAEFEIANEIRLATSVIADRPKLLASEQLQKLHYDRIAAEYEAHYSDASSTEYRRRFIYQPMFAGINLAGTRVLDAMCGSGQTTDYLLAHDAIVTGLDISTGVIDSFKVRWPTCQAERRSLLSSGFADNSFDCVTVVGGLHHIHPNVSEAVQEIHRILKPGGYFCFMEPHSGSLPDIVRRFWYKHDHFFSDNEAAIDLDSLQDEFDSRFTPSRVRYVGNIGFLLVLNSLIFRIPVRVKPLYSTALMALESAISRFQGKLTSCFVIAQWQKQ
jgi:SAM-dependent methyltransferase